MKTFFLALVLSLACSAADAQVYVGVYGPPVYVQPVYMQPVQPMQYVPYFVPHTGLLGRQWWTVQYVAVPVQPIVQPQSKQESPK
jgi:hypothetical protein